MGKALYFLPIPLYPHPANMVDHLSVLVRDGKSVPVFCSAGRAVCLYEREDSSEVRVC